MPTNHHQRTAVRSHLIAYIRNKFLTIIQEELNKYEKNIEFHINENKWSVTTNVDIKYTALGWHQFDEDERIVRVDVSGKILVNGKLAGDFMIHYEPAIGFINLNECVATAIESIDLLELQEGNTIVSNKLLIKDILNDIPLIDENQEDSRIVEIVEALKKMNFPKTKAIELAKITIGKFPELHDIDTLVDEAINLVD